MSFSIVGTETQVFRLAYIFCEIASHLCNSVMISRKLQILNCENTKYSPFLKKQYKSHTLTGTVRSLAKLHNSSLEEFFGPCFDLPMLVFPLQ